MTRVIDPVKNLTLSMGGQKIQVAAGRLDYYSGPTVTMVTIRPNDGSEPLILTVAPADAGKRIFGRRGSLRVMGYAAAATDPDEIDPGVMTWSQVCSCPGAGGAVLKKELLALEPVLSDGELTALGLQA